MRLPPPGAPDLAPVGGTPARHGESGSKVIREPLQLPPDLGEARGDSLLWKCFGHKSAGLPRRVFPIDGSTSAPSSARRALPGPRSTDVIRRGRDSSCGPPSTLRSRDTTRPLRLRARSLLSRRAGCRVTPIARRLRGLRPGRGTAPGARPFDPSGSRGWRPQWASRRDVSWSAPGLRTGRALGSRPHR